MESSRLKQKSYKPQIPPTNLTKSSRISQIPQTSQKSLTSSQVHKPVTNLTKSSRISQIPQTSNKSPSPNAFTNVTNSQTSNKSPSPNAFTNSQTSRNAFTILANMSQQGWRREDVGRGVREDQDEEDDEEDDEGEEGGNDEEQSMVDGATFERAPRTVCDGHYKKMPKDGAPKLGVVTFINKKNIKEAKYKKTLKAIVRTRWDFETAKQKGRARETFLNQCIEEFKKFYEYPPECSGDKIKELEGDVVVRHYLKNNLRRYTNGWKTDGMKRVEAAHKKGDTSANLRNCPPYYLSEPAWNGLVNYWETDGFAKLSEAGRGNVKMSEIKHCSGAKPFDHRYEELEEKASKPLTLLELEEKASRRNRAKT